MSINTQQDPNYLTFKSNPQLSSFGTITFGSNLKEELNHFHNKQQDPKDQSNTKSAYQPSKVNTIPPNPLSHSSYLKAVLYFLYNIPLYKNTICSKAFHFDDSKSKLLCELKTVFTQYDNTKEFYTDHLRYLLSRLFKTQTKFSMNEPDNPIDCYFVLINCLHNYSLQLYPNDISSQQCYNCFSHKYFHMDVLKKEQCDCGWSRSESLSNLNYIMNIPLGKILKLSQNTDLIEMNRTYKFDTLKFSNEKDDRYTIGLCEKKAGKLFFYLSNLINDNSRMTICGKCHRNYIRNSLSIVNPSTYLTFSLCNDNLFSFDMNEILSSLIIIPKIFELGQLFDNSYKNKVFYDFFGIILMRKSMVYSVAMKRPDTTWEYISDDNNTIICQSWFELISVCLKDLCSPIMILYQIQEKYSNKDKELDIEDIRLLERYVYTAQGYNLCSNQFRTNEGIISIENNSKRDNSSRGTLSNTKDNGVVEQSFGLNKNHSSKTSTSNSTTSKNSSILKGDDIIAYVCLYCGVRNKLENVQCVSCMKNNIKLIEKIKAKLDDSFTQHFNPNNYKEVFQQQYQQQHQQHQQHQHHYQQQFQKRNIKNQNQMQLNNEQLKQGNKSKEQQSIYNTINRKGVSNKQNTPVIVNHSYNKTPPMISRDISQDNTMTQPNNNDKSRDHHSKTKKKPISISDQWKCDICDQYNKLSVFRCSSCKTMDKFQKDLLEGKRPQSRTIQQSKNYYTKTEHSGNSTIRKNQRELSLENPNEQLDDNLTMKMKASTIKATRPSSSRMMSSPNKSSSNYHTNSNMTRPKSSMKRTVKNP